MLLVMVGCFVAISWRWPVVNDAALMHYVVFLQQHGQQHGWAPYRVIHDINLPGAYLPDWLAIELSGASGGDLVWRLYDFGLLAAATAAMVAFTYRSDWFAGIFAGALLALFHGRDGIGQAGQRDLAMAVLYLLAGAAFLAGMRRAQADAASRATLCFGGCGLALGAATTIKPFGALLFVLLLLWAVLALRAHRRTALLAAAAGSLGFAVPVLAMALFLLRQHALSSFLTMCRVDLPYHAAGSHPSTLEMLGAAFPDSFIELGLLAAVIMLVRGSWRMRDTQMLLLGLIFSLLCFIAQHKGYSYQRYPYIGFLLLWVGLECTAAMHSSKVLLRSLGVGGLLFGTCYCAPGYLLSASRSTWPEPYLHAIEADLRAAGGPALNGRVQCIDSISGCVSVLYRMRLEQATGTLYDEFLFPPTATSLPGAVRQGQQQFLQALTAHPAQVFIIASWLFPSGPGDYEKLPLWPAFDSYLNANYRLADQQAFPRGENGPLGFRMYVRR